MMDVDVISAGNDFDFINGQVALRMWLLQIQYGWRWFMFGTTLIDWQATVDTSFKPVWLPISITMPIVIFDVNDDMVTGMFITANAWWDGSWSTRFEWNWPFRALYMGFENWGGIKLFIGARLNLGCFLKVD